MDVLSSVMRELHLLAAGYRRLELGAPWAISFSQVGVRGIHVVISGRCEVVFAHGQSSVLEAGDLVVAPRADAHVLCSVGPERAAPLPADEFATNSAGGIIRAGGQGARTSILCGAFAFGEADHPALSGLPRVVGVRGQDGLPPRWLRGYIDAILEEALDEGPGSSVVLARLSAALITRALRHGVDDTGEVGWLRGLRDPSIGKALAVMHDECKEPWSVEQLARTAGLSRAAFAARFHELVGETPMRYLFSRRMRKAVTLLRDGRHSLSAVANATGYQSEAAFSSAFKRHAGVSPGAYRQRALAR